MEAKELQKQKLDMGDGRLYGNGRSMDEQGMSMKQERKEGKGCHKQVFFYSQATWSDTLEGTTDIKVRVLEKKSEEKKGSLIEGSNTL